MDEEDMVMRCCGLFWLFYFCIVSLQLKYRVINGSRLENRRKKGRKDICVFLVRVLYIYKGYYIVMYEFFNDL